MTVSVRVRRGPAGLVLALLVAGCSADGGGEPDVVAMPDATSDLGAPPDAPPGSDVPATDPCPALATCGACAGVAGCGWCLTTARCLAGSSGGSTDGTCMGPAWDFTGDLCGGPDAGGPPPMDSGRCVPSVGRGGENTDALCSNGVDDDCNGYIDCNDFGCSRNPSVTVCHSPHDGGVPTDVPVPPPTDAGSTDAGSTGPIGPTGGTVGRLHFTVFGDVRPPNPNQTSAYPTAIVQQVMQGMRAVGAQFAIASGDYMFADYASTVSAQIGLFRSAEAMYGGYVFHAMGNHECTGATASNCPRATETPNVLAYMSMLNAGRATPYYDWVIHTSMGAAHFIATAPNAWSTTQQTWLHAALAMPATYTFVIAHQPPSGTQGPGSSAIESAIAGRTGGVTLRLYGHTHEFRREGTNAVIDGNAGAPLAGLSTADDYYGFGVIDQRADGNIVFTAYQVGSPPMVMMSFVVTPSGASTH
jgi:hypothetical protein